MRGEKHNIDNQEAVGAQSNISEARGQLYTALCTEKQHMTMTPLSAFHTQFHKSLFPDSQVPGFGAAYSSLWEVLRERITLPMMGALEAILELPRGDSCRD